ncbi:MAG: TIGR02186 family protein, partial [Pseudomonadota bacterium]
MSTEAWARLLTPRRRTTLFAGLIALAVAVLAAGYATAQQSDDTDDADLSEPSAASSSPFPAITASSDDPDRGPEATRVEADVSTRSVAITSSFTGVEIVVFGAVDNAKTPGPEAGLFEIVVAVAGEPTRTIVRKKERRVGIWLNTEAIAFETVPSYYAVASTRPLDEIADESVLDKNAIGFASIPFEPETSAAGAPAIAPADLKAYRDAIVRLKQRERLFQKDPYGVVFVGRNLFRTTIDLPANVPVGPLEARIFLFRNGALVDTFQTEVTLARSGLERYL